VRVTRSWGASMHAEASKQVPTVALEDRPMTPAADGAEKESTHHAISGGVKRPGTQVQSWSGAGPALSPLRQSTLSGAQADLEGVPRPDSPAAIQEARQMSHLYNLYGSKQSQFANSSLYRNPEKVHGNGAFA
jgi:hypothetical protein